MKAGDTVNVSENREPVEVKKNEGYQKQDGLRSVCEGAESGVDTIPAIDTKQGRVLMSRYNFAK